MRDLNDKITKSLLTANEWNELPSELQNVIEGSGQTLLGSDLAQLDKSVVQLAAQGDAYTDSGTANTYVLTKIDNHSTLIDYKDLVRIRFIASNTNTAASTVNVDGLGVKDIKKNNGDDDLTVGDIVAGVLYTLHFDSSKNVFVLPEPLLDVLHDQLAPHKDLIVIRNAGNDDAIDIDASFIQVLDVANSRCTKNLSNINLTMDITNSGALGLDTGTATDDTFYNHWVIWDSTLDIISAIFSLATDPTSITLPSGFDHAGYVGASKRLTGLQQDIKQNGKNVIIVPTSILSNGRATVLTQVNLPEQPPNCFMTNLRFSIFDDAGLATLATINGTNAATFILAEIRSPGGVTAATSMVYVAYISMIETTKFYYKVGNAAHNFVLVHIGWRWD